MRPCSEAFRKGGEAAVASGESASYDGRLSRPEPTALTRSRQRVASSMRYSVVLPRAESSDAEETKQALKTAAELWASGDQREALGAVRGAAWGCSKAGNDMRALSLSKAAKAIQGQLDAATDESDAPEAQPQTRRDTPTS